MGAALRQLVDIGALAVVRERWGRAPALYAPAGMAAGAAAAPAAAAEEGAEEGAEQEAEEDGACVSDGGGDGGNGCGGDGCGGDGDSPTTPRRRRGAIWGAELAASLPRLWASPGGPLRPLLSRQRFFTIADCQAALRSIGQLVSKTTVYHALSRLVASGRLVVDGKVMRGKMTRYALAPEAPAGGDGVGEDEAEEGAAADGGDVARPSSSYDDDAEDQQPDAAAAPDHLQPVPRASPALARAITRLWARPHGALLPLLSSARRSFSCHDVVDALRLPQSRANNTTINNALARLVSMTQLNRVAGSQFEGWRYAPSRATDSDSGGGDGIASEVGADETGAEEEAAEAEAGAAAAALPGKRKHPGRRPEAREAASAGDTAAGARAADWALVDSPPRVAVGERGARTLKKRLRGRPNDAARAADADADDAPAQPPQREKVELHPGHPIAARVDGLLLPGGSLSHHTSASRSTFNRADAVRCLGIASDDKTASNNVGRRLRQLQEAGALHAWKSGGSNAWKRYSIASPPAVAAAAAARAAAAAGAAAKAAAAHPSKAELVAQRVEALVAPPHGAMYLHALVHGFFVAADAVAALWSDGDDEAEDHKAYVNRALRSLVARGALAARVETILTSRRNRYTVATAAAAAPVPPRLPPQKLAPAAVASPADPSALWPAQLAAARRGLLQSRAAAFEAPPPHPAALPPRLAASLVFASAAADEAAGQRGSAPGAAAAHAKPAFPTPASAPLPPCAAVNGDIPCIDDLSGDEGGGDGTARDGSAERRGGGSGGGARERTRSRSRSRSRERACGRWSGRSDDEGRTVQHGGSNSGARDASPPPPMSRPPALRTVSSPSHLLSSRPLPSGDNLFCYADANDPSVSHDPFSLSTFAALAAQGGETEALLRQLSVWPARGGAEGGLQRYAAGERGCAHCARQTAAGAAATRAARA